MKLYALHDKKAKSFSSFHVERSDAVASRNFADAVVAKSNGVEPSVLAKYAEDFELVSLCSVSQDYEGEFSQGMEIVGSLWCAVVITAEQVLAAQPKADAQIPMRLEA